MVEKLFFDRWSNDEKPFIEGKAPLKLMFYEASLNNLTDEESEVVKTLRELVNLPDVEGLQTEPGIFPHLELEEYSFQLGAYPATVDFGNSTLQTTIHFPASLGGMLSQFRSNEINSEFDDSLIQSDLITAVASKSLCHILVTKSPFLIRNRHLRLLKDSNPRTPAEAAQIAGLLLRSRRIYTFAASNRGSESVDRWGFYWVLTRYRLPSMWRYFRACVDAGLALKRLNSNDNTLEIGQSVLERALRSLQARDAIGIEYYKLVDYGDEIMYHFDYLTLLLTGIFDAQATIVYRTYQISKLKERNAKFHIEEFRKELRKHTDTKLLSGVVENEYMNLWHLLHPLRNTIHSAGLQAYTRGRSVSQIEDVLVSVPSEYKANLVKAVQKIGSLEEWGILERGSELSIEPYTYSVALISECFKMINRIADATDVTRLFPLTHPIPILDDNPPQNDTFWNERMMNRIAILG